MVIHVSILNAEEKMQQHPQNHWLILCEWWYEKKSCGHAVNNRDLRLLLEYTGDAESTYQQQPFGERLGQSKTFVSLTNGLMFQGRYLPAEGLHQSSWCPNIPLSATELLAKIGNDTNLELARFSNICESIIAGFPMLHNTQTHHRLSSSFPWPKVKCIKPAPLKYHPMAPVWQNEGTNEGTVAILDNYEEKQCGMDPDNPAWSEKLVLWHGDVKTVLRIRSVQAIRSISGKRPYDSKAWIMPVLGLWHLRYNS